VHKEQIASVKLYFIIVDQTTGHAKRFRTIWRFTLSGYDQLALFPHAISFIRQDPMGKVRKIAVQISGSFTETRTSGIMFEGITTRFVCFVKEEETKVVLAQYVALQILNKERTKMIDCRKAPSTGNCNKYCLRTLEEKSRLWDQAVDATDLTLTIEEWITWAKGPIEGSYVTARLAPFAPFAFLFHSKFPPYSNYSLGSYFTEDRLCHYLLIRRNIQTRMLNAWAMTHTVSAS
jgi:hypothetical protein